MDSLIARIVSILMENNNHLTLIRGTDTTRCDNFEVSELMVVNATHIVLAVSGSDDANIVSSSPSICTLINQGRGLLYEMSVDSHMKCHNLQMIAFCPELVFLGCWWW